MTTPGARGGTEITGLEQLRAIVGEPNARAVEKVRPTLDDVDRAFVDCSPLHLLATSGADGSLDVSPRGDPAGAVRVVDERTLLLPDRPGNRRVDAMTNILGNPHVGLLFLVPRRTDTLRVNGRARLLLDPDDAADLEVRGHRPRIVVEVTVDEVYFHCPKAFMRSHLWDPEAWPPVDLPSVAEIAHRTSPSCSLQELEDRYEPENYRTLLY
ncbi:pyridoxamine 5'-phosphate oxidase family protein [Actinomycetospora straminea]|uniref:Pyridoxamine 5'-phosphate oxidase family protein n=1 Tax=Actinomycetospora straminea TaxID=663607 RepID=A0ABP9EMJ4_9PSEU|nr:pyridoxamine 5'-phosphate oxidase family protein [Actinomycetospora straminea]MDD7933267.1 pyridoxamine 5'-phosphate oxidase family protein [Actinomycetospora straminea]